MSRVILLGMLCFISRLCFAQEWKTADMNRLKADLSLVSSSSRAANYSLSFERKIYTNYNDSVPMSSEKGVFVKGIGKEYTTENSGQLIVQTERIKMVVDTAKHLIILQKPDTLFDPMNVEELFIKKGMDNTFTMSEDEQVTKYQIANKKKTGGNLASEIWINKSTKTVQKIVIYFVASNYFSESVDDETAEMPMVTVSFEQPESIAKNNTFFEINKWVTEKNDTYELNSSLSSQFELQDIRYK